MRPARTGIPSNSAAPGLISAPSVDGHLRRSREKKRCLLTVKAEDNRLDRLEKLIEKSLGLPEYELDTDVRRRCSTAPPTRCSDRGRFGHVARECVGRQLDPRNESPDCQSTVIKSVDEAVAGRLEKNSVAGHGEKKALVTTVDICGEDVALEPVSDELEASVMQWQVEMLASDEYGGESGDEVSSSCETPQMPTPREKGSERDEVGEKPLEAMSESVAEIAPREDEVVLDSPEEAREEIPPGRRESGDMLVSERGTSIVKCTQETRTLAGNERRKRCSARKSFTSARQRAPPPLYGPGAAERLLFVPSMRPARTGIPSNSAAPGLISAPSVDGHLRRSREKKRCLLTVKAEDVELQGCGPA
ncbi:hypothetical protein HPB50_007796 [Hyalomma asiaticum]|uniref:Uncharacterized protein n=1 Tax=Hyalomma asiaticum TaxID=266040 RepID=A0ACB7TCQ2_HYAAI|nr:hypothetical protein HPB50_007796 [Hyalomma asiaticum]